MDNELKIFCTNIGEYVDVEGGETLQHVYERIKDRIKFRPISVMVNNRDKLLAYPLYGPKHVEFIDRSSTYGKTDRLLHDDKRVIRQLMYTRAAIDVVN